MNDIKEQFKKDFDEASKVELSFDLSQLPPNTKKTRHKVHPYKKAIIVATSVLVATSLTIVAIPIAMMMRFENSVQATKRRYSANEIAIAESNTFKKLNSVTYPDLAAPVYHRLSDDEKEAYAHFADATYSSLVETSKDENMSYSVVGLYSILNDLYEAISNDALRERFTDLLGLNSVKRADFYTNLMYANSYAQENSTIQIKNAAFFNDLFDYSPLYVSKLTNLYCEAYRLNFSKDANKIVTWVNEAVNESKFIDEKYLAIDNRTQLFLFSTLYFKNAWSSKYLSENNIDGDFHLADGSTVTAKYMRHSFLIDDYYDYGSYISFRDYYYRGFASVTYLIPKSVDDDIYKLTKGTNIFVDEEDNRVAPENEGAITVNLKTPKFKLRNDIDFKNCLTNLGFADIFDMEHDSFHNAFDDEDAESLNFYMQAIKQRNDVEFNEDGTIVKSITMAKMGAGSAAPGLVSDTLNVELNQPFIYIIRDVNNTPIFVGHVDNPVSK